MRDNSHANQIERWAKFVKENPLTWKKQHTQFINSQILISERFYRKLSSTQDGMKKIKALRRKT